MSKIEKFNLSKEDIKEIFSLFSSVTKYELKQVYNEKSNHYYKKNDINDEYKLVQSKKEYALDAWRAVIYFLYSKGYILKSNGKDINLSFIENEFM